MERFRLFYERELPQFKTGCFHTTLNDPVCDNDCQTDKEEIDISLKFLENEIIESLAQYIKSSTCVTNIQKYHKGSEGNKE